MKGWEVLNLKDTKILIPEIPKEWTKRLRSGHVNIWNEKSNEIELPEVKLSPPTNGLYAERFEDGWYWICGCHTCLENGEPYSYIVCEEHDKCITCNIPRKDLTETPWGHREGFQCKPCHSKEREERKLEALQTAKENGLTEYDCHYTSEMLCPVCFSKNSTDDIHEPGEHEVECSVCDSKFSVEVEYEVRYTSSLN